MPTGSPTGTTRARRTAGALKECFAASPRKLQEVSPAQVGTASVQAQHVVVAQSWHRLERRRCLLQCVVVGFATS